MFKIKVLYFLLACQVWINVNESLTTFGRTRIQNTTKIHNQTNNQDLELIKSGIEDISIRLLSLQSLLTDVSEDVKYYDKHFNCLKNCSTPTCLSNHNIQLLNDLPKNCAEILNTNKFKEGVYLLDGSNSELKAFYAYCVIDDINEKPWTIIQRREDGSVNFNRNWQDYKRGFGDLNGEYWIGLDRLHAMTKSQRYELWVLLKHYNNNIIYAKYSNFSIADENEAYKLNVDGFSGDDYDSFESHNNMKFSTYDNDNDLSYTNCARAYKGGWWYTTSYACNLNGVYRSISNKNTGEGIEWSNGHGYEASLKYAHMAIRPL